MTASLERIIVIFQNIKKYFKKFTKTIESVNRLYFSYNFKFHNSSYILHY